MSKTTILIVEDDAGLREALLDTLLLGNYNVVAADCAEQALMMLSSHTVDLVVSDIQMGEMSGLTLLKSIKAKYPNLPVLLMTAYATIDDAVQAMRDGATDYLSKPFAPEVLLNLVGRYAPAQKIESRTPIVADPSSLKLLELSRKVAKSEATVMVMGPSGSGKEVLSRYIHDQSPRSDAPFVAINCAAIPENMLEATLFGYEKGAFTGAIQACPGKFEQAQDGTLLLDEITEMDLALQAKLLRVLQEREVERLGGRKTVKLNVRVIATSNRDLRKAVDAGEFREDLYYRLNVFPIEWRPLSERPGDIVPLAEHLVQRHTSSQGLGSIRLSAAARNKLSQYSWPGNVRELENVVQRALILCEDNEIDAVDLMIDEDMSAPPEVLQEHVEENR
uniref:sigma-54-dependent transcriptional regulator n=1 Tax=Alteromonas australica TaxID=589873 RepID=UPI0023525B7A